MHYKNGRPAQNGDKIVMTPSSGAPVAGILYDAVAGNDSCNGRIAVTHQNDAYACLSDCLHADDVRSASAPYTPPPTGLSYTDGKNA
jgi:hypothetical protein